MVGARLVCEITNMSMIPNDVEISVKVERGLLYMENKNMWIEIITAIPSAYTSYAERKLNFVSEAVGKENFTTALRYRSSGSPMWHTWSHPITTTIEVV
jgi:hypothetical protein